MSFRRTNILLSKILLASLATPLAFGQAGSPIPLPASQTPNSPAPLAFEVVSIRQNKGETAQHVGPTANGFRMTHMSLSTLVLMAYVPQTGDAAYYNNKQTQGFPEWALKDRYDVEARVAEADLAKWRKPSSQPAMMRAMLQSFLAERCKLEVHRDSKIMPVYSLVVGKSGPKFKETDPEATHPGQANPYGGTIVPEIQVLHFYAISMNAFAPFLSGGAGRPVQDRTGLTGRYDFTFQKPPAIRPPDPQTSGTVPADPGPSLFAIVEELGLKLEPTTGTVETLIVDRLERPSEN